MMQCFSSNKFLPLLFLFFVEKIFATNPIAIQVVQSIPQISSEEIVTVSSASASSPSWSGAEFGANKVFDGDMTTRWGSNFSDPQHLVLDLGQSHELSKIIIHWEAANAQNYTIEASDDNSNWEVLSTITNGTFGDRSDEISISGNYRYLKINGTSRSVGNNWGYSIWEVEIYKESLILNDSDLDGVDDAFDECPATLPDIAVKLNGCDINGGYESPMFYDGYTYIQSLSDEFSDNSLDLTKWTHEIGNGCQYGICYWGNNEKQYYQSENIRVGNGRLTITAKKNDNGYLHTSGRIKSQGKMSVKYGRIDIRAKMPYGQGIWPALWMLGEASDSWPAKGEIDIMEMIGGDETGRDDTTHGTIHWDADGFYAYNGGTETLDSGILADEYHVYSIVWTPTSISWYLDGNPNPYHFEDITHSNRSEFRAPFYFIMNVAVGGNWPGDPDNTTIFPQEMAVDYIRVFQEQ